MWAIITLASLIILFILILSIPLDFVFDINTHKSPRFSIRLLWLFGLVDADLRKIKSKPKQKKQTIEDKPKKRRGPRISTIYQILRIDKLFDNVIRLLRGILNSIKIKSLNADFRVGFDNPADTGLLFGIAAPINLLFSYLPYDINFQPSFNNKTILEGNFNGNVRLRPMKLVTSISGFIFSLQSIRILRILITEWIRKK